MKFLKKILSFELKGDNLPLAQGIFTVIISILFYLTTLGTTATYSTSSIGPVTIPRFVCGAIFVLGVAQIAMWCIRRAKSPEAKKDKKEQKKEQPLERLDVIRKLTPPVTFILLAIYIWLMGKIGFVLASTMYLTLQIPLLSVDFRPKFFVKSAIIGIVVSTVVFLLFAKGFQLHLPVGPWGF